MGENRNKLNLGDQILRAVDDILESGNFDKLNSVVSDTVYKALDETQKHLEKVTSSLEGQSGAKVSNVKNQPVMAPKAKIQRVGNVAGILLQVFGGIGTGVFGISAVIFLLSMTLGPWFGGLAFLMGILAGISGIMIGAGVSKRARLKRAERYVQVMQGKSYMNLQELAYLTNTSERYVRKDIKKMIRMGIFPEGHLDQQEKCLMLNDTGIDEAYKTPSKTDSTYALSIAKQMGINDISLHYVTRPYLTRHGRGPLSEEISRNLLSSSVQECRTNHYNEFQEKRRWFCGFWWGVPRIERSIGPI